MLEQGFVCYGYFRAWSSVLWWSERFGSSVRMCASVRHRSLKNLRTATIPRKRRLSRPGSRELWWWKDRVRGLILFDRRGGYLALLDGHLTLRGVHRSSKNAASMTLAWATGIGAPLNTPRSRKHMSRDYR